MTEQEQRIVNLFLGGESHCATAMRHFHKEVPDIALAAISASSISLTLDAAGREGFRLTMLASMATPVNYQTMLFAVTNKDFSALRVLTAVAQFMPGMVVALIDDMENPQPKTKKAAVDNRFVDTAEQLLAVINVEILPLNPVTNRVAAIKAIRTATGMGLKDGKDLVDELASTVIAGTSFDLAKLSHWPGLNHNVLSAHYHGLTKAGDTPVAVESPAVYHPQLRDVLLRLLSVENNWLEQEPVII